MIDAVLQSDFGAVSLIPLILAGATVALVVRKELRQEKANKSTGLNGRAARRAYRFSQIDDLVQQFSGHGVIGVKVRRVYQRARRGSKAIIVLPDGDKVDAWFWWYTPQAGSVVYVKPSVGYGEHEGLDNVHYVGTPYRHGVIGTLRAGDARFHASYAKARARTSGVRFR